MKAVQWLDEHKEEGRKEEREGRLSTTKMEPREGSSNFSLKVHWRGRSPFQSDWNEEPVPGYVETQCRLSKGSNRHCTLSYPSTLSPLLQVSLSLFSLSKSLFPSLAPSLPPAWSQRRVHRHLHSFLVCFRVLRNPSIDYPPPSRSIP